MTASPSDAKIGGVTPTSESDSPAPPESDDCQSCGSDDEPLTHVRRIYVTPASWDSEGSKQPAAHTELWCDVCMIHYPHEVIT